MRGSPPENAAAPANVRKSRRWIVMSYPRPSGSANFHVFPEFFLTGGLENRRFRQRLGFLRGSYRGIEIALGGRLLGGNQRCRRRGPLIAQGACFLVGGFGGGIGGAEIGLGCGLQGSNADAQQDKCKWKDGCPHLDLPHGRAPGPEIGSPLLT